jgi:hypothetical protein
VKVRGCRGCCHALRRYRPVVLGSRGDESLPPDRPSSWRRASAGTAPHGAQLQSSGCRHARRQPIGGPLGSTGGIGDCFNNSVAESLLATLETDCSTGSPGPHVSGWPMPSSRSSKGSTTVAGVTPRPATISPANTRKQPRWTPHRDRRMMLSPNPHRSETWSHSGEHRPST